MSLTDDWKAGKLNEKSCEYVKILAHFVELTEKVKGLEKDVDKGDMIIGKLLNEGKAATEKNKQLRQLLERGIQLLSFEHEEYEVMSFVSEVNEVLK